MQALRLKSPGDRPSAQAELEQLKASDHAVLPIGKVGQRRIPTHARLCIYLMLNGASAIHRPIVAVVR
jgi:hypothetical protein